MNECRESNPVRLPVSRREEEPQVCRAGLALRQGEIEVGGGGQGGLSHHLGQAWLESQLLDDCVGWQ